MKHIVDIASDHPTYTAPRGHTVLEVVRHMSEVGVGAMPVIDDGKVVGIFTERDLMTRVVAAGLDPDRTPVESVMTTDLVLAEAGEPYLVSLQKMQQTGCRHLPVMQDGVLVGMVSLRDLLQVEVTEKEEEVKMIVSYMYSLPSGSGSA
jgi:CBS domain-containing protein